MDSNETPTIPDSGRTLEDLEKVIERGRETYIEVGNALLEIRDRRLYLRENGGDYNDFDTYCRERWGWSMRHVERHMEAARVIADLQATNWSGPVPTNEAQARELSRVEPEQRAEVMAAASADGKPTAESIRREAQARTGEAPKPKTQRKRTQGAFREVTAEQEREIVRARQEGKTRPEVVAELGVNEKAVQDVDRRENARQQQLDELRKMPTEELAKVLNRDIPERTPVTEPQAANKKPTASNKRMRELYDERRAGRPQTTLWELQLAIAKAAREVEHFQIPEGLDWDDEDVQFKMEELADDVERILVWAENASQAVNAHMDELSRHRRYQKLRARANDPSSGQNEREMAARAAERMRQRQGAARLSG